MMKTNLWKVLVVSVVVILTLGLVGCTTPEPEVVEVTREVEKVVTQIVKETIKETVVVEGTPEVVEREVTRIVESVVTATPEPPEPEEEVTLIVAVPDDIQTLDVCCTNFIRGNQAEFHVYDPPVIFPTLETASGALVGDTSRLEGLIFESWERQPNGTDIKVKIREGLTHYNTGREITADDVAYMIERSLNTPGGMNWLCNNIMSVTTPPTVNSKYELTIHSDRPNPLTIPALYMSGASIADSIEIKAHATADDPWAMDWMPKNVAGGSGPFYIDEWIPEQEVIFKAREDYYRGKAQIDTLIWKIVPSPASRVTLLLNGAVDVVEGLTTEELRALEGKPGVKILTAPSKNMVYLGMSSSIEPFSDQRVRQAISYAVDYDDIIESVYYGSAQRLKSSLPAGSEYATEEYWPYDRDLEKAKSLLAEAGYPDGLDVTLFIDSSRAQHELIAVRVQSHLKEAGINVTIEKMSSSVFAEKKVGKELPFFSDESLAWMDDPNYVLSLGMLTGVFGNYTDYSNERVDEIINNGWTELDLEKRHEMFNEAQQIILEEASWVYLAQPDYHLAVRENVYGYVHHINEIVRYYDFYKSD
jgi:peptide/nickel transport system substrate-binding protein